MSVYNFATTNLAGSSAQAGGFYPYLMENSLRFTNESNSHLSRVFATDGNRKTWTWSAWVKRGNIGSLQRLWGTINGSSQEENIKFEANNTIRWYSHNAGGSAADNDLTTVAVFRDVTSWYHIQIVKDTTQSTAANRNKLYVNGVLQSWAGTSYASLNYDGWINASGSDNTHRIGAHAYSTGSQPFDGYMAEVNFVDGQALSPTSFGEDKEGVWIPVKPSGLTFGTNGFYLPFKQNTSSGTSGLFTDASTSYIQWANTSHYDIGSSDDFTLEFFMRPSTAEMAQYSYIVGNYVSTSGPHMAVQRSGNDFYFYYGNGAAYTFTHTAGDIVANQWHHIVINRVSGTVRFFIDGTQKGATQTSSTVALDNNSFRVGLAQQNGSNAFDGYLSNVRLVIGSAVYSDGTSITVPTSTLTNVTNTKLLALTTSTLTQDASSNNVTGTTSGSPSFSYDSPFTTESFYSDASGNNNDFVESNISHTDQMIDTPTNNFAVMNSIEASSGVSITLSEGNLKAVGTTSSYSGGLASTFEQSSGKWYWEVLIVSETTAGTNYYNFIGAATGENNLVHKNTNSQIPSAAAGVNGWSWEGDGTINLIGTGTKAVNSVSAPSAGDVLGFAIDLDNGNVYFYYNGVAQNSGSAVITGVTGLLHNPSVGLYNSTVVTVNFGQDSSFAGNKTAQGNADGNGQGDFFYAPPSNFLAFCSANLPEPSIIDGTENFNTVLYTGNAGTQSITGVGFDPDFTWAKNRASSSYHHELYDTVRGNNLRVFTSQTQAEATGYLQFISDGFSLTAGGGINASGNAHVAWNWKGGGTAVSNTDGSISSTVSANTAAGFSIVSFDTGGNTSGTVGHGLGVQPQLILGKTRNHQIGWYIQTPLLDANLSLAFDAAAAYNPGYNHWNDTHPTSSVFSVGGYMADHADLTNPSTKIAYCFANVEGYCKVGNWTGNNTASGPFVYTGFEPQWVLFKRTDNATGSYWNIMDNKRNNLPAGNPIDTVLMAHVNTNEAGLSDIPLDFLSNGFKVRTTGTSVNGTNATYLYLALAENPFKYSNAR